MYHGVCHLWTILVLIDKKRTGLDIRLDLWRKTLKDKYLKISRAKAEYMECKFSKNRNEKMILIKIDDQEMPQNDLICYLESRIQIGYRYISIYIHIYVCMYVNVYIYAIELELVGWNGEMHLEYYMIGAYLGDSRKKFIEW